MDWKVLLILLISEYVQKSETDPICTSYTCNTASKQKRHADPIYRYRPQFSKCRIQSECDRLHKYLFLSTGSSYQNLVKECSFTVYLRDAADLYQHISNITDMNSMAILIVHTTYRHKILYSELINAMVSQLGNLSLFADDRSKYHELSNACDSSQKCVNLMSLIPVIEQSKQWNRNFHTLSSTALDLYDSRWLPIGENELPSLKLANVYQYYSVDLQVQLLAAALCARSRRYNLYYEVAPRIMYEEPGDGEMRTYETGDMGEPPESRLELMDILPLDPKKYDKNKPPKNRSRPTLVDFHVTVLSLDSINEESMTYVADIFLAQSWRDQRLRLPESMGHYRILDVDWLHDIWKPDSFFKNAKHVTFHEISVPNHYLWLYHDKTLLYMSKLSLVLSCAMKFESYPHDTQICSMMIESLSHTTQDLIFRWNSTDPLVVNPEIELPQLDIARNFTADCTIQYSTGTLEFVSCPSQTILWITFAIWCRLHYDNFRLYGNFTCLAVVFSLRRRLGYHLFHTYIPSALIVVMSWISFWIKPEAIPARVTLGVTSLLTLATQNTQSQQSLPPVSYVKAIDIWMSSCSIFVFLSLMEFAIVNNYMGPVATKAMKGYSEEDMRVEDDIKGLQADGTPTRNFAVGPQYVTFCNDKAVAVYIDKFSRVFFPFSFIVLNIAYWTSFL